MGSSNSNDTIELMKIKLKAVMKLKINKEKDLCKARSSVQSLNEEIVTVKAETDFLKEQLEDVKNQIVQMKHQISMIEICSTSEKSKINTHIANLERHRDGFQKLFDTERDFFDLRLKELQNKEAEQIELQRQKNKEATKKRELKEREAASVEAECEALEQECAVLKKRNNAIMLKLRRKLLETENFRRELLKKY